MAASQNHASPFSACGRSVLQVDKATPNQSNLKLPGRGLLGIALLFNGPIQGENSDSLGRARDDSLAHSCSGAADGNWAGILG